MTSLGGGRGGVSLIFELGVRFRVRKRRETCRKYRPEEDIIIFETCSRYHNFTLFLVTYIPS